MNVQTETVVNVATGAEAEMKVFDTVAIENQIMELARAERITK